MRPVIQQNLNGYRDGPGQTGGKFAVNDPAQPGVLDITGQCTKNIAKWKQGVSLSGVNITAPTGDDQIGLGIQRQAGELEEQAGFAPAGFTGDKNHPALALQSLIQVLA